tara:strand:- start:607 stop:897 length:291 start_codon:yes stop_codon:yes gene_type:complete
MTTTNTTNQTDAPLRFQEGRTYKVHYTSPLSGARRDRGTVRITKIEQLDFMTKRATIVWNGKKSVRSIYRNRVGEILWISEEPNIVLHAHDIVADA